MLQTKFKLKAYTKDSGERQVLAIVRLPNSKQFTLATDVHVNPKRWTKTRGAVSKWVVKGEDRADLNRKLATTKSKIDEQIRFAEANRFDVFQHLKETFKPDPNAPDRNDLLSILQSIVDGIESKNTRANLQGAINKLKAYGEIKSPADLSKQSYREFSEWLLIPANEGGWGLTKDSGAQAVTNSLKTLTNKATDAGLLPPINLGVLKWTPQPINKITLTMPELERMKAFTFDNETLDFVRDCYVFCVETSLRFSEMQALSKETLNLRSTEDGYLGTVERIKRKRFQQSLPFTPLAISILDKWDYNLNRYNCATHNRKLKEIGLAIEMMEPEHLTVVIRGREVPYYVADSETGHERPPFRYELLQHHTSRNTFISHAYQRGVPERIIQQVADHDDPKQTRRYDRTRDSEYATQYLSHKEHNGVGKFEVRRKA